MRKPSWMSVIMIMGAVVGSTGVAFAGITNTVPYSDNFERYTNGTPLINGTNGWYGSYSTIVVQTNVVSTGSNAAVIPVDCSLSNLFQSVPITNVWIQMDVWPVLYDGTNNPVADTNKSVQLYINSNGNFVVHNGLATPSPTNSVNWVVLTNFVVGANGTNWVTIDINEKFYQTTTNWDLYANGALLTNNIGFVNTSLTNFAGFSVYNGSDTSYVDNVSVTHHQPGTNYYLNVTPAIVTNSVMRGYATNSTLTIANNGASNMEWTARATSTWIRIVGQTNGTIAGGGSINMVVTNSALNLTPRSYTGSVVVAATNEDNHWDPESSAVTFVLQVMLLTNTPAQLTDVVMQGEWTNNSFRVWNAGAGVLNYTVTTTNLSWLVLSSSGGSLTGQTDTIMVTYTNTASLIVGPNYGTITIASSDGGGATNTLGVILNVRAMPMLNVSPTLLANTVMSGQSLANQPLRVWNSSAYYPIWYQVATNAPWLTVQVTNNYLAPLAANILTVQYAAGLLTQSGDVPSNYTGSITVTATDANSAPAGGSPVTIPVNVTVNPKPRMALSLTNLSQTVLQGRDAVSQGFDVWNANGYYTLSYTVAKGNTNWLLLTPTSGTSTGEHATVTVQYSTANLPAGNTTAAITVVGRALVNGADRDSALDATQTVWVALTVTPFATLMTDAQSTNYVVRRGLTPPDTVFSVWNGASPQNSMYFTVSPSASWLSVTPSSGTSTGNIVTVRVKADATDMKPGVVYRGTVKIDATDTGSGKTAYGSPQTLAISVVLRNFQGFDFQGGLSGASDLVLYREANGAWDIRNLLSNYATTQYLGGAGYQAVPGDYTGGGVTEMGVYRPASGGWYAQQVGAGSAGIVGGVVSQWSGDDYVGVQGDYDADGKTDPGVYLERSGLWMLLMSGSGYQQASAIFGGPGYTALRGGDYDGDCKADPGVYHRTSGLWFLFLSTSQSILSGTFGGTGFVPVPTDYDGDAITDPAVYATETGYWYILPSTTLTSQGYGLWTRQFGGVAMSATLTPAPGNYDGVGGADLGLYDTSTWRWYIMTLDGVPLAWNYPMGRLGSSPVLP